jgi:EAL domain-containing protein (putative c-di-GMP-specific phosphodiesterase class I)
VDSLDAAAELIPHVLRERAIFPVYQPIMDLATGAIVGVEALARGPAGSPVEFPLALLAAASRARLLPLVDQLCFTRAIEIAREAADIVPPLLFANAEPAAVNQPVTPDLLAAVRSERRFRIVMEYTERALAAHPASLLSLANLAYQDGNALALDDVGADPMSLAFLPLLEPEVVKLDAHLLRDPHSSSTVETAAIVNSYAERTGAVVVAEGIETENDLTTAPALGARWGQGWLFGRPGPLTAIAGRPLQPGARLRPARPDLYLPSGTPFTVAAMGDHIRACDQRTIDELTEYLVSVATSSGSHIVVLAAYPNQAAVEAWLPRLAMVANTATFVGIVGPGPPGGDPHRAGVATDQPGNETALAVVGPRAAVALCARPTSARRAELVLTHDPNRVHAVARLLMWLVGTAVDRRDPTAAPGELQNRGGQPAGSKQLIYTSRRS